jgi:ribosome-binding factor A
MNLRKSKSQSNSLAAELHSDDGQNPKEFFRKSTESRKSGRKALQLCSQVADTLSLVLSGECASEILQNLLVAQVTPAPDASQLLVLLVPAPGSRPAPAGEVLAEVHAASGRLRTAVAGAISRKRAPRLVFQFLPLLPEQETNA